MPRSALYSTAVRLDAWCTLVNHVQTLRPFCPHKDTSYSISSDKIGVYSILTAEKDIIKTRCREKCFPFINVAHKRKKKRKTVQSSKQMDKLNFPPFSFLWSCCGFPVEVSTGLGFKPVSQLRSQHRAVQERKSNSDSVSRGWKTKTMTVNKTLYIFIYFIL